MSKVTGSKHWGRELPEPLVFEKRVTWEWGIHSRLKLILNQEIKGWAHLLGQDSVMSGVEEGW